MPNINLFLTIAVSISGNDNFMECCQVISGKWLADCITSGQRCKPPINASHTEHTHTVCRLKFKLRFEFGNYCEVLLCFFFLLLFSFLLFISLNFCTTCTHCEPLCQRRLNIGWVLNHGNVIKQTSLFLMVWNYPFWPDWLIQQSEVVFFYSLVVFVQKILACVEYCAMFFCSAFSFPDGYQSLFQRTETKYTTPQFFFYLCTITYTHTLEWIRETERKIGRILTRNFFPIFWQIDKLFSFGDFFFYLFASMSVCSWLFCSLFKRWRKWQTKKIFLYEINTQASFVVVFPCL